uniref:Uncharacterized protein n=1 Tax=Aegilops tauschii subsp. strangulata TaxID=200361 RepID=A0A453SAR6_AEGTS
VMPYSTGCRTALSNFEAELDYRVCFRSNNHGVFPYCRRCGQCISCRMDHNSLNSPKQSSIMCQCQSCVCQVTIV